MMLCCVQVCLSTVGVLGDISRNVEEDILPYCDQIMSTLIQVWLSSSRCSSTGAVQQLDTPCVVSEQV